MIYYFNFRRCKLILAISVTVILLFIYIFNNNTKPTEPFGLDLLKNFCNRSSNYLDDNKKQPQWVLDNRKATHLLTESDKVSHMYGENNEHKYAMKGDTTLKDNVWDGLPVKGAFYMIVRNEDLGKARETMRSIEDRFNGKINTSYPYIFLNNQRFTPEFKKYIKMVSSNPDQVYFGQIDLDAWSFPYWIDSNRANNAMQRMDYFKIKNAHSQYFHQVQRYQSGLFFHHSLFDTVEYVWHIEAGTTYTCEMFHNDPFETMKNNKKKIGFALTSKESSSAMFSLWPSTLHFMREYQNNILPPDSTIMPWLMSNEKEYNFCHMWTSFQIVDLAFLKSYEYQFYFHYLDLVGGFFYERWTDGPVRSLAAALFLKRDQVHFFNDIGFDRNRIEHCPYNDKLLERCTCDFRYSNDYSKDSCTIDLLNFINPSAIDDMVTFAKSKAKRQAILKQQQR